MGMRTKTVTEELAEALEMAQEAMSDMCLQDSYSVAWAAINNALVRCEVENAWPTREAELTEALRSECDAFDYHVETGGKTQPGYTQEVWQRNRDAIRDQSPENDPAMKAMIEEAESRPQPLCPTCGGFGSVFVVVEIDQPRVWEPCPECRSCLTCGGDGRYLAGNSVWSCPVCRPVN